MKKVQSNDMDSVMRSAVVKYSRLHRDRYYEMCVRELMNRDGLTELPGDGPFWGECYEMTEDIYGPEDDPASKYLPASENQIAANPALSHVEKVRQIEEVRDARERREWIRDAKREAAKTPEQRASEKENKRRFHEFLDSCLGRATDPEEEEEDNDTDWAADSPSPVAQVEVIERPFQQHISEIDKIRAHASGIKLD